MKLVLATLALTALVCLAAGESCSKACPAIFLPTCASDGKVYSNPCVMENKACETNQELTAMEMVFCNSQPEVRAAKKCSHKCTKEWRPVCGSDKKIYGNPCMFRAGQCETNGELKEMDRSYCKSKRSAEECQTMCTAEWNPVCGSDKKIYGNPCMFGAANCKVNGKLTPMDMSHCKSKRSSEECKRKCRKDRRPVCGSDKKIYGNPCMFEVGQCEASGELQQMDMSFCQSKRAADKCAAICTKEWNPVCGSDKKIYGNPCMFRAGRCETNGQLKEMDMSYCKSKRAADKCAPICTKEYNPICGSDKKMYGNPCMFKAGQCEANGKLKQMDRSYCESKRAADKCAAICTKEWNPVCGSDKKMYGNPCMFRAGQCEANGKLKQMDRSYCE